MGFAGQGTCVSIAQSESFKVNAQRWCGWLPPRIWFRQLQCSFYCEVPPWNPNLESTSVYQLQCSVYCTFPPWNQNLESSSVYYSVHFIFSQGLYTCLNFLPQVAHIVYGLFERGLFYGFFLGAEFVQFPFSSIVKLYEAAAKSRLLDHPGANLVKFSIRLI